MNDWHRHTAVSDAEKVKGLLDGTVDPSELEEDSELYALAERIYGRETLDEMGITAPVVPKTVFEEPEYYNGNNHEVELPDEPEEVLPSESKSKTRRVRISLFAGLFGLMVVSLNIVVGIGSFVELCEDSPQNLPIEFNTQANMQGDALHITWTITNLNPASQYSVAWTISENGSHTFVDSEWFNWTSQDTYIHSLSRSIEITPWCYISTLYENQTEVASSNDCEGQIDVMSETIDVTDGCDENTRLVWIDVAEYRNLNSWEPAGSGDLIDGALLMLFLMFFISGLRRGGNNLLNTS